jgi:fibronectin type 3 domain-containing protein
VTTVADQNQLVGWLSTARPDIVLMHFGTNDVWSSRSTATILTAYSKLVDQMRASNPAMKILVAKIIPMAASACGTGCPERVVDLNNAIPGWAASRTTSQSPITVVDQWTGFSTSSDTYDGVHPNAAGDQKISDKWFPALTAALGGTTPQPLPPGAPGTPTVSGVTASSVGLTWAASSGPVSTYEIERCQGSTCTNFSQVGVSTTTSFINNSGLTANTTYRYRVRATNSAGSSPYSGIANVTTTGTTGCVPSNLAVSATTPSSISLTWSPPPAPCNTAGYDVFRVPGTSGGTYVQIAQPTTTSYTDSGLASGSTFRYQVRARDTMGNLSAFTTAVTGTTGTTQQPPGTPGTPSASAGSTTVSLAWTASSGTVTAYEIERATGPTSTSFAAVGTSTSTSFTNSGLSPNTTYRYRVRATNSAGSSAYSSITNVTTSGGTTSPPPPGGCSGVYRVTNTWSGGFQAEVTVTNTGTAPTTGWSLVMTFPNGQRITQIWGARTMQTASLYTITNESWNGALQPNASTGFGFLGSWSGTNNPPSITCSRTP